MCRPLKFCFALIAAAAACVPACRALDPGDTLDQYGRQTWHTEAGLPQATVHAIAQTRDGFIWLATDGGLVRFDGYRFTVLDSENTAALTSNHIRSLAEDRAGRPLACDANWRIPAHERRDAMSYYR